MSAGDGRENEIKVRVDKGKPSEAKERGRGITAGGAITTEDDDLRVFLVVEIVGCTEITMGFLLNGSFFFYYGLYRNYNGFSLHGPRGPLLECRQPTIMC